MAEDIPQQSAQPTTTQEQDRKTESQREINRMWERTQSWIALWVVSANIIYVFVHPFLPPSAKDGALLLSNAFFLVIGFYFGRTNHTNVGGIPKETR
jgi:hypothetical protein